MVHGEAEASKALAASIRERFQLDVHIPRWRERLILKPREMSIEAPEEPKAQPDLKVAALNAVLDLENQLKNLRNRVKTPENQDILSEEDVDRLKYIEEELREILTDASNNI